MTGSEHKLEVALFSSELRITQFLNICCERYKIPIIFSAEFFDYLSPCLRKLCRLVDVILCQYQTQPIFLFTIELQKNSVPVESSFLMNMNETIEFLLKKPTISSHGVLPGLVNAIHNLMDLEVPFESTDATIFLLFESLRKESGVQPPVLDQLMHLHTPIYQYYRTIYHLGLLFFLSGSWSCANDFFHLCLQFNPTDIATNDFIFYMARFDVAAPKEWNGIRSN